MPGEDAGELVFHVARARAYVLRRFSDWRGYTCAPSNLVFVTRDKPDKFAARAVLNAHAARRESR